MCPFFASCPFIPPHQGLPAAAGGASAAGICRCSHAGRKMLFISMHRTNLSSQVPRCPQVMGLWVPAAHMDFSLPRAAGSTLVPGGAEHAENGLPCLRHLASLGPPRLPPGVVQGPAVALAPSLTQQLLPPAAPLPLGFDISWPRPGVFAAPTLQPALPPPSKAPAVSHCSPAAFPSPNLDQTSPPVWPFAPPAQADTHECDETSLRVQIMFMSKDKRLHSGRSINMGAESLC